MATRADACESHRECTCRVYTAYGARRFVQLADEAVLVIGRRIARSMKIRPPLWPEGPTKKVNLIGGYERRASSGARARNVIGTVRGLETLVPTQGIWVTLQPNIPWKSNQISRLHRKISHLGVYVA